MIETFRRDNYDEDNGLSVKGKTEQEAKDKLQAMLDMPRIDLDWKTMLMKEIGR